MSRFARPALAVALAASLLAGCGAGGPPRPTLSPGERAAQFLRGNPSAIVAAELAFARAAQEKGQWTAFADYATDDAVMFVPEAVRAKTWLKGRANPAEAVRWQPHQVWASCDGTLAASKGAWQRPDGSTGYFTTLWSRQRNGAYKWVLDQGDSVAQPLEAPAMIGGTVADCPARTNRFERGERLPSATLTAPACDAGTCRGGGASADGTLVYGYSVAPSGARELTVQLRQQGEMREILRSDVSAP
jgi:hypothetical protein